MIFPPIQGVLQPVVEGNVIGKFLMVLIPKKSKGLDSTKSPSISS